MKGRTAPSRPGRRSLGLAIHELATNAVKYGALSAEGGAVTIGWQLADGERLTLRWVETGGPVLDFAEGPPADSGFGSKMTKLAAQQLGGSLTRDWPSSGAVIELSFPLPQG